MKYFIFGFLVFRGLPPWSGLRAAIYITYDMINYWYNYWLIIEKLLFFDPKIFGLKIVLHVTWPFYRKSTVDSEKNGEHIFWAPKSFFRKKGFKKLTFLRSKSNYIKAQVSNFSHKSQNFGPTNFGPSNPWMNLCTK